MGACIGPHIPQQRILMKKQYTLERGTINMKLEIESTKVQTAQTELMQTYKTTSQNFNFQHNEQTKTKKNISHVSNQQQPSAREMKLSQVVSDIQNQLRTQSILQTMDNIFLRTLQTQVDPFDRRQSIKQTHIYPYNCIGMLFYSVQGEGQQKKNREHFYFTAFLVSPNIIMSSARTLIRYLQGNFITPLKFLIRQSENQTLRNIFSKARLIKNIFKQQNTGAISSSENIKNSYCLLQLQSQVKRQKYLPLGSQFNMEAEVQIYGFPMHNLILENQKGDRQNLFGMKGEAKVYQNCIQYDIYTSTGQQGAPILYSPIQGEYLVIGIHSGYVGRDESFQKNSHILDMLELNSHIIKKQVRLNTGTRITRQILTQLKRWGKQSQSLNRIQFINCENLTSDIFKSHIKLSKIQKLNLNDAKTSQFSQFDTILIRFIQKAQKQYSKWQPHTSIQFCEKALQQLNNSNQYFVFKINFILALNYRLLVQLEIALLYFTKCDQCLNQIKNKSIQHYILFVDLYSNLSITYLQNEDYLYAKKFLRKAQQIVKRLKLFQHNANIGVLITKGIIEKQQRLTESALKHFNEALKIYQKTKSSNIRVIQRQRLVCIQQNIADCYYLSGNLQAWAMTGLQCIKQLYDIDLISRIFQIQWFQNFLTTVSKEKLNLSLDCQFKAARILSCLFQNSISITSERFKKDFLNNLRMIRREIIGNFEQ